MSDGDVNGDDLSGTIKRSKRSRSREDLAKTEDGGRVARGDGSKGGGVSGGGCGSWRGRGGRAGDGVLADEGCAKGWRRRDGGGGG